MPPFPEFGRDVRPSIARTEIQSFRNKRDIRADMAKFPLRFLPLLVCLLAIAPAQAASDRSWSGIHSNVAELAVRVSRTEADWTALWAEIGRTPPTALPQGKMGVAVFLGFRSSGGFAVRVDAFEDGECLRVVRFAEAPPPPGAAAIKMITFPWTVELLPATEKPVVFEPAAPQSRRSIIPASEGTRLAALSEACARGTGK